MSVLGACWAQPILGKRHDVEVRQLAEKHVRCACKKKGKKDNWQKRSGRKCACRGEKCARPACKKT
jgi:hypothetical protein